MTLKFNRVLEPVKVMHNFIRLSAAAHECYRFDKVLTMLKTILPSLPRAVKMPSTSVTIQSTTGKRRKNRWVLCLVLNDRRHFDDVTFDGGLFQVLAAATGNARSPIVESRVSGTASAEVDDERRRCRPGLSSDRL